MSAPPIYFARITPRLDGTFRFDTSGDVAVIMDVHDSLGELRDFVAWLLDDPGRWWFRVGDVCPLLGAENIEPAILLRESIALHPNPEAWARAAGRGVCVLDWDVHLYEIFVGIPGIKCESPSLKYRLRRALRRWEPPITEVTRVTRHAA